MDEAEKPITEYDSINAFFTRKLKSGIRPVSSSNIVHPADSRLSQVDEISEGKLIQVKGKSYGIQEFLLGIENLDRFSNGVSATYYLCPTDYHRVHSPVRGKISKLVHVPGHLWPVNQWSVNSIDKLFSVNERVLIEIETDFGPVVLVMVGATNVGKISLSFLPGFYSNQDLKLKEKNLAIPLTLPTDVFVQKGEELGIFHMGSTVVMIYPETVKAKLKQELFPVLGNQVKMGSWA